MDIISRIERYRKEKNLRKEQLCRYCKINQNTYTNYLKGGKVPFGVASDMLEFMGKQILIIDKIDRP